MKKPTFIVLLIFLILSPFMTYKISADEDGSEDETINIIDNFYVSTSKKNNTFVVPFNRSWFKKDARIYDHNLAKASIGLATAAFRPNAAVDTGERPPEYNLRFFLYQAGFEDVRSDDYDKDPSMYTVSTAMGHQKIGEGADAFELIAVGICGQGYLDEWESNFNIGTGNNPTGFDSASQLVYDRVFGYISANHLSGKLKIWLSGSSRAGAVCNITAAKLSDSDTFSQESVFAYTFGTPNTVREDPGDYENIFNICGKMDPVAAVPFSDWGYSRYGITLYTPTFETDSDFMEKRQKADVVYKEITGITYWNNYEMNAQIRTIMDCLMRICPSVEVYEASLQDNIIALWEKHDLISVAQRFMEMANDPILINEANRKDANILLNQFSNLILEYVGSQNSFRRYNKDASVASNIMQTHTCELYMSWIYSVDEGEDLYSAAMDYKQLYLSGDVEVKLYRDEILIETLSVRDDYSNKNHQYLTLQRGEVQVLIPRDRNYRVEITSLADQQISALEVEYTIGHQTPSEEMTMYFSLREGETLNVDFEPNEATSFSLSSIYSEAAAFESSDYLGEKNIIDYIYKDYYGITWREMALTVIILSIIAVSFAIFLVTLLSMYIRLRYNRMRGYIPSTVHFRPLPIVCFFLVQQLFLIKEFYLGIYDGNLAKVAKIKFLIGFLVMIVAYCGYRRKKSFFHLLIIPAVFLLTLADVFMTSSVIGGSLLYIGAYILLIYDYVKKDPPRKSQFIGWIIMSLIGSIVIVNVRAGSIAEKITGIFYIITASALVCSSYGLSSRTFRGSCTLLLSGVLLMVNTVRGANFITHIIASGIYYIGVMMIASSGNSFSRPKTIPETMSETTW